MTIRIEDLATTDFSDVVDGDGRIPPVKPGDVLLHDFMEPFKLSARALASALSVPPNRITGVINGTRSVSAETAFMLSRYFGMDDPMFWMNLQSRYDMEMAQDEIGDKLEAITPRELVDA